MLCAVVQALHPWKAHGVPEDVACRQAHVFDYRKSMCRWCILPKAQLLLVVPNNNNNNHAQAHSGRGWVARRTPGKHKQTAEPYATSRHLQSLLYSVHRAGHINWSASQFGRPGHAGTNRTTCLKHFDSGQAQAWAQTRRQHRGARNGIHSTPQLKTKPTTCCSYIEMFRVHSNGREVQPSGPCAYQALPPEARQLPPPQGSSRIVEVDDAFPANAGRRGAPVSRRISRPPKRPPRPARPLPLRATGA